MKVAIIYNNDNDIIALVEMHPDLEAELYKRDLTLGEVHTVETIEDIKEWD